jgi:ABC-2 type transport system permease protein
MFSVLITLLFGAFFLKIPIVFSEINWGLFFAAIVLGLLAMISLGIILGSWTLIIKNNAWSLGESLGAGLLIFSGAVFPLNILPAPLQWIGSALPISYWLALIRRALVPEIGRAYPMYTDDPMGVFNPHPAWVTLAYLVIAALVYKRLDFIARERGNIDMVSNY